MKNKRQIVNSIMVNFDYKNGVQEYQKLFLAFVDFFNSLEVNETLSKMQIAHFLENFLRKENIVQTLTIADVNGLMDSDYVKINLNSINIYQNIFLLLYEELSSNNKQVSKYIYRIISNVNNELLKNNNSSPDCFNCDRKFICKKETRDIELISKLQQEDKEKFSNLTKDVRNFFTNQDQEFSKDISKNNLNLIREFLLKDRNEN